MNESTTGTSQDTGNDGSIEAATNAFAKYLAGDDDGTQDESEAQPAEGEEPGAVEDTEPEAQAEEEESDPDDDESPEEEKAAPGTYTVKVDGQEVEVSVDELLNGYSRTQDYTRKTQALAEQRRAVEAEAKAIREERAQYATLLTALQQQIAPQLESEPDWARLRAEDPIEYAAQWADWQQRQQRAQAIQYEQQRVAQLRAREHAETLSVQLQQEATALVESIPEWKDEKKAAEDKRAIVEYAQRLGYRPEELAQTYDHRAVLALRKAMLYDKLMASRGQLRPQQQPSAPTLKPGPARGIAQRPTSELTRAKQRLAKTGSTRDAAAVFEKLLG